MAVAWYNDPSQYSLKVERYHPDIHRTSNPAYHSTFWRGGVKYAYVKVYGAEMGGVSKAKSGRSYYEKQREGTDTTPTVGQARFRTEQVTRESGSEPMRITYSGTKAGYTRPQTSVLIAESEKPTATTQQTQTSYPQTRAKSTMFSFARGTPAETTRQKVSPSVQRAKSREYESPLLGRLKKEQEWQTKAKAYTGKLTEPKKPSVSGFLATKAEQYEIKSMKLQTTEKQYGKSAFYGALAFGVGSAKGHYELPKATLGQAQSVGKRLFYGEPYTTEEIATKTFKSFGAVGSALQKRPLTTAGELTTLWTTPKIGAGIVKYQPIKFVTIERAGTPVYKGIEVNVRGRGFAITGQKVSTGKISIGSPKKLLPEITTGAKYEKVASLTERNLLFKAFPEEATGAKLAVKVSKKTQTTPSAFVTKEIKQGTQLLTPAETKVIYKWARKKDALVYGSAGAKQSAPKGALREGVDIDVGVALPEEILAPEAKGLSSELSKASGNEFRIAKKSQTLIEKRGVSSGKKQWVHAVDIHSTEGAGYSQFMLRERTYGFNLGQKPIKIEKTRFMPLSEQGLRKMQGAWRFSEKKGKVSFAPQPHRIKDIGDFIGTQEVLLKSKIIPSRGASKALGQLKQMYTKEIKLGETAPTTKTLLFSPRQATSPVPRVSGFSSFSKLSSPNISSPSISRQFASPSIGVRPSISAKIVPKSGRAFISPKPSAKPYSPKISVSPRISSKPSTSAKPYSPKISVSPSISPKPSTSPYPKTSPSPRPSPSPYPRPSPSPYPSPSYGIPTQKFYTPPRPKTNWIGSEKFIMKKTPIYQPKKWKPTAWAIIGKKYGTSTKGGVKTGFGLRPLKRKSKKRR